MKLKGALGTKNGALKSTRILPGKSVAVGLASLSSLRAGSYTATVTLIQNKQKTTLTKHDPGALSALLEAAPLDGRRIRAVAALAGSASPAEIVARTGVTLREVERVLAARGTLPPRTPLSDGDGMASCWPASRSR